MKVLKRNEVIIIDSNLKEDNPRFDLEQSYPKDSIVCDDKYLYLALQETQNKPLSESLSWKKIGSTNEWACFDYFLNTISVAKNELNLTFSCFGARGLYLASLRAKFLNIEIRDNRTGEVIESKFYKLYGHTIKSWSEYFFGSWGKKFKHNIYYERTTFTRNISFNIRAWGLERIELGSVIVGDLEELAVSLYDNNSISMLDFSKVLTDEEGNTSLTIGNFKRTNAFNILVKDELMDSVSYQLQELRGQAVVFIIANNFEALMNFGFLKNHEILLSKVGYSIVSIEIEGLI